MDKILLATTNTSKIKELKDIFKQTGVEILSLNDLDTRYETPVEDGNSYQENAKIKAVYYSKLTGLPCIADDSGLEVQVLDNKPGIFSARYAGDNATSAENNQKLVNALGMLNHSSACYTCTLCLYDHKTGLKRYTHGTCSGEIRVTPKGTNGFGYDPYFYVDGDSGTENCIKLQKSVPIRNNSPADKPGLSR